VPATVELIVIVEANDPVELRFTGFGLKDALTLGEEDEAERDIGPENPFLLVRLTEDTPERPSRKVTECGWAEIEKSGKAGIPTLTTMPGNVFVPK